MALTLNKGQLFTSIAGFDRKMHMVGVPRHAWDVTVDKLDFATLNQKALWAPDSDTPFQLLASEQRSFIKNMMAVCSGSADKTLADFSGFLFCSSSVPVATMAELHAALLVRTILDNYTNASIVWHDINTITRWGNPIGPDIREDAVAPHFVVLTGFHPSPTKENYEAGKRWVTWATKYAPVFIVGTGVDPVELAIKHYNMQPNAFFYSREVARVRTVG